MDNLNVLRKILKTTKLKPIEKEIKKGDKDGDKDIITIIYQIKFVDNARFMASPLSNLFDNHATL